MSLPAPPAVAAAPPTVARLLRARADDHRPALLFENERWTWAEFVAECTARAAWLRERRAEQPDGRLHVGVLLDNQPEFLFLIGGAALSGTVIVGLNDTRRGDDLQRDVTHTECDLLVTSSTSRVLLDGHGVDARHDVEARHDVDGRQRRPPGRNDDLALPTVLVDAADYRHTITTASRELPAESADPDPSSLLLLLFTSGTTSHPKAVRCSTARLATIAASAAAGFGVTADDVLYQAMPLFHGNALMANWAPALHVGGCVAMRGRFSASGFLRDIRSSGATFFNYVGKALTYILATPEQPDDADNPLVRCFGNEASHHDISEFQRRFGCVIREGYGSSEGGAVISVTPSTPPGALGEGREGVCILDPESGAERPRARFDASARLVNDEAIGEIANVLGAPGFEGYWKNPEADRERVRDGIYWSGDLGYRDEDGYFWFAGRSANWLRVDGENLAAAAIERIIGRCPGVVLCAVYGVPDPLSGDAVMVAIEPAAGAGADTGSAVGSIGGFAVDRFGAFLAAQPDLGTKMVPRFVRLVESMPQTATMKTDRRPLQQVSWGSLATSRFDDAAVFVRVGRSFDYRPLVGAEREALTAEYLHHGRGHLLPPK